MSKSLRRILSLFLALTLAVTPLTAAAEGLEQEAEESQIIEETPAPENFESPDPEEPVSEEPPAVEETPEMVVSPKEEKPVSEESEEPAQALGEVADSGTCGTNLTWELDDSGKLTISGTGAMTNYSYYDDAPWYSFREDIRTVEIQPGVTTIGDYAFRDCSSLTSVVIPDSVTTIGDYAFRNCGNLTSVVIPDSVATIGDFAFQYCGSLTSVVIPDSVTTIDDYAFYNCVSLTSVDIPDSVTTIGVASVYGCTSLAEITVSENNPAYTSEAGVLFDKAKTELLQYPGGKGGGYIIPAGVTTIGDYAFGECYSLTSVVIPDSVTAIGDYAFKYCVSLTSVVIPDSVTAIGDSAFDNCASLTSVVIGNSVTAIGAWAFSDCDSLTSVEIPDSVTTIGSRAFADCNRLKSITIPASVTDIGEYAFEWCDNLKTVVFLGSAPNLGDSIFRSNSLTAYYPEDDATWTQAVRQNYGGTVAWVAGQPEVSDITWELDDSGKLTISGTGAMADYSYDEGAPWASRREEIRAVEIQPGVTTIGDYAFQHCYSLTSVVIPDSVTTIGDYAFGNCDKLTSVVIPDSVTAIGDYAFWACFSLTSVVIPDSVTTIGNAAFQYCYSLTSVVIPDSVTAIGSRAFADCYRLAEITVSENNPAYTSEAGVLFDKTKTELLQYAGGKKGGYIIPAGVTTIGDYAFWDYSSLTSVVIPDSVTAIGNSAFGNCGSLTSVVIPDSVTTIGDDAFEGCYNLTSVVIGNSVTTIGNSAFRDCYSLTSVVIPDSVTTIGEEAFYRCTSLKSITIPASVTWIDHYVFYECRNLKTVVFLGSAPNLGDYVFGTNDLTVYYPEDDPTWTEEVRQSCGGNVTWAAGLPEVSDITWELDDSGKLTISGTGAMPDYSYDEGAPWASRREEIRAVEIQPGVTTVGSYAFYKCSNLRTVDLPSTLTVIGQDAFEFCNALTAVTIPDGVKEIRGWAFSNCLNMQSVTFPNSLKSIGASAFSSCRHLTEIYLPASLTDLSDSVWSVFNDCTKLERIDADPANPSFASQDGVLFNKSMTELYLCPEGRSGSYAIPGTVQTIGEYAFSWCQKLTEVTIPDSVTEVGYRALMGCNGLRSIAVPANVSDIGEGAFSSCSTLTSIQVAASNPNYTSVDGVLFNKDKTELHCYPGGKYGAYTVPAGVEAIGYYAFDSCGQLTAVTLPSGLRVVGNSAFSNCWNLRTVTLPDGLEVIGWDAFNYCTKLRSITIPASVTWIDNYAFYECRNLKTVVFLGSAPEMGSWAFEGTSLTAYYPEGDPTWTEEVRQSYGGSVIWKTGLPDTSIEVLASGTCGANLTWQLDESGTLTVSGTGVMTDYWGAAPWDSWKEQIEQVVFEPGITRIGEHAFYECYNLTEVSFPDTLTEIGAYAFYICENLCSVRIPASVTDIGIAAFSWCGSLMEIPVDSANPVYCSEDGIVFSKDGSALVIFPSGRSDVYEIPANVVEIADYAFAWCFALQGVAIPEGVTYIGDSAFFNCNSLETLSVPASVEEIGFEAFSVCYSLEEIQVDSANAAYSSQDGVLFNKAKTTLICVPTGKYGSYAVPNGVKTLAVYAFFASHLDEIELPSGLTKIDNYAFIDARQLTSITLPASVKTIGGGAFARAVELKEIYFAGKAPTIGQYAFDGVTAKAYYPEKDSSWTKSVRQNYGGVLTWKTYTPEKEPMEPFSAAIFQADHLLESGVLDTYLERISQASPAQVILSAAPQQTKDTLWQSVSNQMEQIAEQSNASGFRLEQQDIYESILVNAVLNTVNPASNPGLSRKLAESAQSQALTVMDRIKKTVRTDYGWELDEKAAYSSLSAAERQNVSAAISKTLLDPELKEQYYQMDTVLDSLNQLASGAGSAQNVVERVFLYSELWNVTSSMGTVLSVMKEEAPGSAVEMRSALNDCAESLLAASEEQFESGAFVGSFSGNDLEAAAQLGMQTISNFVMNDTVNTDPEVSLLLFAYRARQPLTGLLTNEVQPNEQAFKLNVVCEYYDVMEAAIGELETQFEAAPNAQNAQGILTSVSLLDSLTAEDVDCSSVFADAADEDWLKAIENTLGQKNGKTNDLVNYAEAVNGEFSELQQEAGWDWVNDLKQDYGDLFSDFQLIAMDPSTKPNQGQKIDKSLQTDAPVNVAVFAGDSSKLLELEQQDTILGGLIEGASFGDWKLLNFYSDVDFKVEFVSNEDGVMNLDIQDYDSLHVSRTAEFEDVEISRNTDYTFKTIGNVDKGELYSMFDGEGVISASYDSAFDMDRNHVHSFVLRKFVWSANYGACTAWMACPDCGAFLSVNSSVKTTIDVTQMQICKSARAVLNGQAYTTETTLPLDGDSQPYVIAISQDYLALTVGQTAQLELLNTVDTVNWEVIPLTGADTVASVSPAGVVTAQNPGSADIRASVTIGDLTYTTTCRVDVVEQTGSGMAIAEQVAVNGVTLLDTKATVELYRTDYTRLSILLNLEQNMTVFAEGAMDTNGGHAIESARFANPDAAKNFAIRVVDDRTLELIPTAHAIANPGMVKNVKSTLIVTVEGREFLTQSLSLTVKKTLPKVKAKAVKINSFDAAPAPLVFTGAKVVAVEPNGALPQGFELEGMTLRYTGISPKTSAKVNLLVTVENVEVTRPVTVSVSVSRTEPAVKLSPASVTLLPGTLDQAQVKLNRTEDLEIVVVGANGQPTDKIHWELSDGILTVSAPDADAAGQTYKCYVNVAGASKKAVLTIKTSGAAPSMSLKASGTMDMAVTGSPVTITPKFSGYHAGSGEHYTVSVIQNGTGRDVTESVCVTPKGSTLTLTAKEALAQGFTYTAVVRAELDNDGECICEKTVKLSVKWSDPAKVPASVTLKASGSIDVVRPGTSVKLTPKFKNLYTHQLSENDLIFFENKQPIAEAPFTVTVEDGAYVLTNNGANSASKYTVAFCAGGVTSKAVAISVKMAAVKVTQSAKSVTLLKKDRCSSQTVHISLPKGVSVIEGYGQDSTSGRWYQIEDLGSGTVRISFKDNVPAPKAATIKLGIYLAGNRAGKANANISIKVNLK